MDERDVQIACDFWEECKSHVQSSIREYGVPLLNCEPETPRDYGRIRVKRELRALGYETDYFQRGIAVFQYRYETAHGRIKTKWLTGEQWLKETHRLVACCCWIFIPVRIKPRKKSYRPEDQQFEYLMYLRECSEVRAKTGKRFNIFEAKITTAWNGSPLGQIRSKENIDSEFLYKFAFPRAIVAKINRHLAENHWPVLWCGPNYYAWHLAGGNLAVYMGTRGYRSLEPCEKQLPFLLENDSNGTTATLLSYVFFSVLKPFFPQYHTLEKDTPYLKAKKYLPRQIALCVYGDLPYLAQHLVDLCCGCFYLTKFEKRFPIRDGIVVQINHNKSTKLSVNEFEAKVLQPACVLWMNRIPESALLEDGRIIHIHAKEDAKQIDAKCFSLDLIARLTDRVVLKRIEQLDEFDKEIHESAFPLLKSFLDEAIEIAERFNRDLDDIELKEILDQMHASEPPGPVNVLKQLMRYIKDDVDRQMKFLNDFAKSQEQSFLDAVTAANKRCYTQILRQCKKSAAGFFSFAADYENALLKLKPYSNRIGNALVSKFGFLLAASEVYVRLCISKENQAWFRNKFRRGLETALLQQKEEWRAADILEQYIVQTISAGRCARIRGHGSDQADLWYDPREKIFLLPSGSYFPMLQPLLAGQPATKAEFEGKLADEEMILVVQRAEQIRRTFEIKVRAGSGKVSCLKVMVQKFSKKFFSNSKMRTALDEMNADKSSLRTHSMKV